MESRLPLDALSQAIAEKRREAWSISAVCWIWSNGERLNVAMANGVDLPP